MKTKTRAAFEIRIHKASIKSNRTRLLVQTILLPSIPNNFLLPTIRTRENKLMFEKFYALFFCFSSLPAYIPNHHRGFCSHCFYWSLVRRWKQKLKGGGRARGQNFHYLLLLFSVTGFCFELRKHPWISWKMCMEMNCFDLPLASSYAKHSQNIFLLLRHFLVDYDKIKLFIALNLFNCCTKTFLLSTKANGKDLRRAGMKSTAFSFFLSSFLQQCQQQQICVN